MPPQKDVIPLGDLSLQHQNCETQSGQAGGGRRRLPQRRKNHEQIFMSIDGAK